MNLIFDFDGTLCDNLGATITIANKYLPFIGKQPTTELEYRTLGFKGLLQSRSIPLFLGLFISPFMRWEYSQILPSLDLFPWVPQTITSLAKKHTLGILTNNSTQTVTSIFIRNKLDTQFTFISSELNPFDKHSSLQKLLTNYSFIPEQTYYIGDALRDIEAAHKIGVKSIGVTWGHESDSLLASAKPTLLISSPQDLLEI